MSLNKLRSSIDELDNQIIKLFLERQKLAESVALEKQKTNSPTITDINRENDILENRKQISSAQANEIEMLVRDLIQLSKLKQADVLKIEIGVYGQRGTYSDIVASKLFPNCPKQYYKSFSDLLAATEPMYTIVPWQNNITGFIPDVLDALKLNGYKKLMATYPLTIEHQLMGHGDLNEVKTVYSHPQVLKQCSNFLAQYNTVAVDNTAEAINYLQDNSDAIIGSASLGLPIIKSNIANKTPNITQFIILEA